MYTIVSPLSPAKKAPGYGDFAVWKTWLALVGGLLFGLTLSSCGEREPEEPVELKRAAAVVKYMMAPNQLRRSSFLAVFPEGKPSDFVIWMFSTFGTAEWPPYEDGDPMELEQAKSIRAPVIPSDVYLNPREPEPKKGKQLVIKSDDLRGLIIIEGYLNPQEPPVFRREWKLPRLEDKK